jgi:hypothetical protein
VLYRYCRKFLESCWLADFSNRSIQALEMRLGELRSFARTRKLTPLALYQLNCTQKWQNILWPFQTVPSCSGWVLFRVSDFDIPISGLSGLGISNFIIPFHRTSRLCGTGVKMFRSKRYIAPGVRHEPVVMHWHFAERFRRYAWQG